MAASGDQEPELTAPTADETWLDRAARQLRRTLDILSGLALGYALANDADVISTAVYLLVMFLIFPRPRLAEYLRRKPDAPWVMIAAGVLLALYMLATNALGVGVLRHVLPGVGLALAGWSCLLLVRSEEGAGMTGRRFVVGVVGMLVNALGVVLVLARAGAAANGA